MLENNEKNEIIDILLCPLRLVLKNKDFENGLLQFNIEKRRYSF